MLPSDVTGVRIYDQRTREFVYRPGPASVHRPRRRDQPRDPKTQAALLEAMEERQVTIDGKTYPMERPFLVMATQNPIEYEGHVSPPEAQTDRFMMRVSLGYPAPQDETPVLESQRERHPMGRWTGGRATNCRTSPGRNQRDLCRRADQGVHHRDGNATRRHADIYLGVSRVAA